MMLFLWLLESSQDEVGKYAGRSAQDPSTYGLQERSLMEENRGLRTQLGSLKTENERLKETIAALEGSLDLKAKDIVAFKQLVADGETVSNREKQGLAEAYERLLRTNNASLKRAFPQVNTDALNAQLEEAITEIRAQYF